MSALAHAATKPVADWREQLALVVTTTREMSRQTDPQEMRRIYVERMSQLRPIDASVSISRRGLQPPWYRVTRSTRWTEDVNPWKEAHRLPLLSGGLLAELIYGDQPRLFDDLRVPDDDPAAEYLAEFRSVVAIPLYDGGAALNMALLMRREPGAFDPADLPDLVMMSNLFGRATHDLLLMQRLQEAYDAADHEMKLVADIQRSLLPKKSPQIPTLATATYYHTSQRAGGDYYDFFHFADGQWGILIADVSGHGTPAAVLMAVTHSLAHTYNGPPTPPGELLNYVNSYLARLYTSESNTFVTAFYGVYDPAKRTLRYASAGHPPPRLLRRGAAAPVELDSAAGVPLGIEAAERYREQQVQLAPGDQLLLYTDGITEAEAADGSMFGTARLDAAVQGGAASPANLLRSVLNAVDAYTGSRPATDDRTLLAAQVL
ncbi:MAG TPA: PP2C family protein-serine/threonine phosphatase [Gemmataceae bacterium]|nr:PP2C family protein-serine/threonine phosphatase [Gemmataceae bacterium]